MAPREVDLRQRKDHVLGITVKEYIKTVTPVSSALIVREYPLDLSSATIRNILAELEEEGFLMHPHTSAGRIPTQKGYRYYVDYLMDEIKLLEEEKRRIKTEYERETQVLEDLLERTSQVVSETTHYTGIVSVDGWDHRMFCRGSNYVVEYLEDQDIVKIRKILLALEEKERILEVINRDLAKKIEVFIGGEISCDGIQDCSLVISGYKAKNGPSGRIAILGPTRMDYERVVSTLDYFSELMEEIL